MCKMCSFSLTPTFFFPQHFFSLTLYIPLLLYFHVQVNEKNVSVFVIWFQGFQETWRRRIWICVSCSTKQWWFACLYQSDSFNKRIITQKCYPRSVNTLEVGCYSYHQILWIFQYWKWNTRNALYCYGICAIWISRWFDSSLNLYIVCYCLKCLFVDRNIEPNIFISLRKKSWRFFFKLRMAYFVFPPFLLYFVIFVSIFAPPRSEKSCSCSWRSKTSEYFDWIR